MKLPALFNPRNIALILATLLIAGLLFSRALLSIMMGAGIVLLLFPSVRNVFLEVFKRPLRYLVAGVLIYYTWLLILDRDLYTLERMALHLGVISLLVLLHFMAASSGRLLLLVLTAAVLSTLPTVYDMLVHEGLAALYEKGQVAYTLMDGDHQRFSIWISGCLALSWYAWLMEHKKQALYFIIYFTIFLILLSVRTGWLFTGVVTVAGGLIWLQRQHKRVYWIRAIIGVVLLSALTYSIPFVRSKIHYMQWEWTERQAAEELGASDAVRRIVNENAVQLIRENSLGWGEANAAEVLEARNYQNHRLRDNNYKWPFNQYLKWLLSAGWIMGLLPLLLIIYMLYRLYFTRNYLTAVWVLFIALTGLYESTLEMQYGFFLAVFFTVLLYLYESGLVKKSMKW
jgi:hypothetical protein